MRRQFHDREEATARSRRVLVVTSDVPFVEGGHRVIARSLAQELQRAGHESEVLTTPQNRFGRQFSAYLATWLTDVGESGDGRPVDNVISLRFPSYAVRHPRHASWLNHRMREYYDLWPRLSASLSWKGRAKELVRRTLIRRLDTFLLRRNVTKVYVQSRTIAERLQRWGGIPSEILYPPPPDRPYRNEAPEDFVFTVSRLQSLKRVDLLLHAVAEMRSRTLRAVIAGSGPEEQSLRKLAAELGIAQRIDFLGSVDEATLVDRYARCRGVFFAPLREDYGFVTAEAFRSGKPVLTAADSGGPAELVVDGTSGFVTEAAPAAFAKALDRWSEDADLAQRMGRAGRETAVGITWPRVIDKLLI